MSSSRRVTHADMCVLRDLQHELHQLALGSYKLEQELGRIVGEEVKQRPLPFDYLTTTEGILEHLKAYMARDEHVSDPQHYTQLKRGVRHLINTLEAHHERQAS